MTATRLYWFAQRVLPFKDLENTYAPDKILMYVVHTLQSDAILKFGLPTRRWNCFVRLYPEGYWLLGEPPTGIIIRIEEDHTA